MAPPTKRSNSTYSIFLLAIAGLFTIAFFVLLNNNQSPDEVIIVVKPTRVTNHHKDEEEMIIITKPKQVEKIKKKVSSLIKLEKCSPAKHSLISKAASDRNIAARLQNLCKTTCKITDKNKLPPNTKNDDDGNWQPEFCQPETKSTIRYDHGCYDEKLENYNNYNPHGQDHRQEEEHPVDDCDNDKGDDDVTAVFTAISNSSVGARFFGSCQEYAWESIRQWRLFHPSSSSSSSCSGKTKNKNRIFMIVSTELFINPLVQKNATHFDVTLVDFEKELINDDWRRYESVFYVQGYMHPCGSRKSGNRDFNKLVSARFFAIEALMRQRNLRHVMCLENDMMVYTNFAETVQAVKNCGWRIASMFPHSKGVIPGLMYVRDSRDMLKLSQFINDLLSCGSGFGNALTKGYANDMTYMLNFYQMYGGEWMGDLPNTNTISGKENCVAAQMPNLIHDGASFGQWYSFALKMEPPIKNLLDSVVPLANGDKLPANAQCGHEEEEELENGKNQKYFKTSGCVSWEKPLQDLAKNTKEGTPISTAKPPLHVRNSMKGRFVDATPGELVKWRFDDQGRRVPYWGKFKLSSLHVHAKNLFWFRSK